MRRDLYINRILTAVVLFIWAIAANADVLTSLAEASETCRQAAVQLNWLAQTQSRKDCTNNLSDDALNVYYSSKYILDNQLTQAQKVLSSAIIQTNYTIDIGCNGQANIQSVLVNLKSVLQAISRC